MKSVDIFWTGGLDSTYRVLELLLVVKTVVQPFYVIDSSRSSTLYELKTIDRIRAELTKLHEDAANRLRPVRCCLVSDISADAQVTRMYQRLRSQLEIGVQYDWLSRFTGMVKSEEMELCFEKSPPGQENELEKRILKHVTGHGHQCRLVGIDNSDLMLFQNFRFPVVHLTKIQMWQQSGKQGFQNLLKSAWFCHKPGRNGIPCGRCRPCEQAKKSKIAYDFQFESEKIAMRLKHSFGETARHVYRNFFK
jgi:hypothetical protein